MLVVGERHVRAYKHAVFQCHAVRHHDVRLYLHILAYLYTVVYLHVAVQLAAVANAAPPDTHERVYHKPLAQLGFRVCPNEIIGSHAVRFLHIFPFA